MRRNFMEPHTVNKSILFRFLQRESGVTGQFPSAFSIIKIPKEIKPFGKIQIKKAANRGGISADSKKPFLQFPVQVSKCDPHAASAMPVNDKNTLCMERICRGCRGHRKSNSLCIILKAAGPFSRFRRLGIYSFGYSGESTLSFSATRLSLP